jgi:hypothetical protein
MQAICRFFHLSHLRNYPDPVYLLVIERSGSGRRGSRVPLDRIFGNEFRGTKGLHSKDCQTIGLLFFDSRE